MSEGAQVASKIPRKMRVARRVVKLWARAPSAVERPQRMAFMARNLAEGKRWTR